jgi:exonuclease III
MGEKHEYSVVLILSKSLKKSLTEWKAVSERVLIARLNTRLRKLTIVQCYAPTNEATMEEKEAFYGLMETTLNQIRQSDITIMMADFNVKIGDDNQGVKHVMGRNGLGNRNENGEIFIDLCANYEMRIGGSLFPHKATWVAPNNRTSNQIDHIAISKKWRKSLLDVRSYRGADVASDHYLVVAQLKLKLAPNRSSNQRVTRKKFNIQKLNHRETRKKFEEELKDSLEQVYMEESDPTEQWTKIKEAMLSKGENILGLRQERRRRIGLRKKHGKK